MSSSNSNKNFSISYFVNEKSNKNNKFKDSKKIAEEKTKGKWIEKELLFKEKFEKE